MNSYNLTNEQINNKINNIIDSINQNNFTTINEVNDTINSNNDTLLYYMINNNYDVKILEKIITNENFTWVYKNNIAGYSELTLAIQKKNNKIFYLLLKYIKKKEANKLSESDAIINLPHYYFYDCFFGIYKMNPTSDSNSDLIQKNLLYNVLKYGTDVMKNETIDYVENINNISDNRIVKYIKSCIRLLIVILSEYYENYVNDQKIFKSIINILPSNILPENMYIIINNIMVRESDRLLKNNENKFEFRNNDDFFYFMNEDKSKDLISTILDKIDMLPDLSSKSSYIFFNATLEANNEIILNMESNKLSYNKETKLFRWYNYKTKTYENISEEIISEKIMKTKINLKYCFETFIYAIKNKNLDILNLNAIKTQIIANDKDPKYFIQTNYERSKTLYPIDFAIKTNNFEIIEYIRSLSKYPRNNVNDHLFKIQNIRPIDYYVHTKNKTEVDKILNNNPKEINSINKTNKTCIFYAYQNKDIEGFKYLMMKGADIDKNNYLSLSISEGYFELSNLILDNLNDKTIKRLNRKWTNGNIPLHYAVSMNNIQLVDKITTMMVTNNMSITDTNNDNENILHIVTKNNSTEMIKLLFTKYSNILKPIINNYDNNNINPLLYSVEKNNLEIFDILVNNEADINLVDYRGFNSIDISLINQYVNFIEYLNKNNKLDINYLLLMIINKKYIPTDDTVNIVNNIIINHKNFDYNLVFSNNETIMTKCIKLKLNKLAEKIIKEKIREDDINKYAIKSLVYNSTVFGYFLDKYGESLLETTDSKNNSLLDIIIDNLIHQTMYKNTVEKSFELIIDRKIIKREKLTEKQIENLISYLSVIYSITQSQSKASFQNDYYENKKLKLVVNRSDKLKNNKKNNKKYIDLYKSLLNNKNLYYSSNSFEELYYLLKVKINKPGSYHQIRDNIQENLFMSVNSIEIEFIGERGIDVGGLKNMYFSQLLDDLKETIFKCDQRVGNYLCFNEDFMIDGNDFNSQQNRNMIIFLGEFLGLCQSLNLVTGFPLNPFILYHLVTGDLKELSDNDFLNILLYYFRLENNDNKSLIINKKLLDDSSKCFLYFIYKNRIDNKDENIETLLKNNINDAKCLKHDKGDEKIGTKYDRDTYEEYDLKNINNKNVSEYVKVMKQQFYLTQINYINLLKKGFMNLQQYRKYNTLDVDTIMSNLSESIFGVNTLYVENFVNSNVEISGTQTEITELRDLLKRLLREGYLENMMKLFTGNTVIPNDIRTNKLKINIKDNLMGYLGGINVEVSCIEHTCFNEIEVNRKNYKEIIENGIKMGTMGIGTNLAGGFINIKNIYTYNKSNYYKLKGLKN